ncbi:MAG: hypothetical protein LUC33_00480 [Prevotellaceae bacterium]|nr:hypothetical protein [Prevotellaceae bacterium]
MIKDLSLLQAVTDIKNNDMADIIHVEEPEYEAILRQAVAVIDRSRAMVATTVCSAIGIAH